MLILKFDMFWQVGGSFESGAHMPMRSPLVPAGQGGKPYVP